MKRLLFILLIPSILEAAKVELAESGSVCNEKCGSFSIEYPFGIREGCYRDGFRISCKKDNNTGIYKPYYSNVEIINISILPPQMRIYNLISYACYNSSGLQVSGIRRSLNFANTIYSFSDTLNKFTAIGCRTLAYIEDISDQIEPYMGGCLSICNSNSSVVDKAPCSGLGCCQTSIPKGMKYYDVIFDNRLDHSYVVDFSPCSYAFLGDQEYIFSSSDVNMYEFYDKNKRGMPIMLDWAIGNSSCAKSSNMTDYACRSEYSYCVESDNGPGYTCNCLIGFQGNPYILGGCIAKVELAESGSFCNEKCGKFAIEYPFGIREGCYRDGFQISCKKDKDTGIYKPYYSNVEIINISILPPQMRIYNLISYACYDSNGLQVSDRRIALNFTNTIYRFSDTRNKFTAIGCRTLAYIEDLSDQIDPYMSGCLSICNSDSSVVDKAPCSGMGCCQTSIPKGMKYFDVRFDRGFNHSYSVDFSPCSYAFLGDQEYIFSSSDVNMYEFYDKNKRGMPIMLDWAIGNSSCAKSSNMTDYACRSEYSNCVDSDNGPGYTCTCSIGFQGNPYILGLGGCIDIDECINKKQNNCFGECRNVEGSFECTCPSGQEGDPSQQGSCQPKRKLLLQLLLIGALCIFLITAVVYIVYEKTKLSRAKRNCFRQNGGLLLQEQISAHQCVRFKIFPAEEINRATNNFHEAQIVGRGGQGIVYEGIVDDKRRVAIKKSLMIDEKKKKEFAKEMYILSLINHKNVIQILGCCLEVDVPMLVYEFISRGTLFQLIQNKIQSMSFGLRLKIAVESASAFAYLHSDASPSIVHGDIKSSNILLDDDYNAKVSDFGASFLPLNYVTEAGVPGTYGYLDPESLLTGRLTENSDVYSFAVVVLELLTRKKAVYSDDVGVKRNLAQTFTVQGLEKILDKEIRKEISPKQILEFEKMLRLCLREVGEERPAMTQVVTFLRKMKDSNCSLLEEGNFEYAKYVDGESGMDTTGTSFASSSFCSSESRPAFEFHSRFTR